MKREFYLLLYRRLVALRNISSVRKEEYLEFNKTVMYDLVVCSRTYKPV